MNRLWYDEQLHYVVAFEGRLDENRLRRAVRLAMDAEPVFGCRYVPAKTPYWERRSDLDSLTLCELVETADTQPEVERFAARPCDSTKDPLVQALIARDASDTLCLKVNHVAADGAGGKELLYLIAALYRALEDPAYTVTPNLGSRGAMRFLRQFGLWRCLGALHFPAVRPPDNVWRFPTGDLQDIGSRTFATRRMTALESQALREYANDAGATLNDVMLAAFFRAFWRFLDFPPNIPQSITVPMDLRAYLPAGKTEAICNFVAPLFLTLARADGEPFTETLRRVTGGLHSLELREEYALFCQLLMALAHHAFLEKIRQRMDAAARKCLEDGVTTVHFTNNRTVSLAKLDFGIPVVDVDQFVPAAVPPGLWIGVFSFRGSLRFTTSYFSRAMKSYDIERLLDVFLEELPAIGASGVPSGVAPMRCRDADQSGARSA